MKPIKNLPLITLLFQVSTAAVAGEFQVVEDSYSDYSPQHQLELSRFIEDVQQYHRQLLSRSVAGVSHQDALPLDGFADQNAQSFRLSSGYATNAGRNGEHLPEVDSAFLDLDAYFTRQSLSFDEQTSWGAFLQVRDFVRSEADPYDSIRLGGFFQHRQQTEHFEHAVSLQVEQWWLGDDPLRTDVFASYEVVPESWLDSRQFSLEPWARFMWYEASWNEDDAFADVLRLGVAGHYRGDWFNRAVHLSPYVYQDQLSEFEWQGEQAAGFEVDVRLVDWADITLVTGSDFRWYERLDEIEGLSTSVDRGWRWAPYADVAWQYDVLSLGLRGEYEQQQSQYGRWDYKTTRASAYIGLVDQ